MNRQEDMGGKATFYDGMPPALPCETSTREQKLFGKGFCSCTVMLLVLPAFAVGGVLISMIIWIW